MGLFKKKENRDGRPVDREEMKMKSGQQLQQEYYSKHPEKKYPTLKKIGGGLSKLDKKVVQYNRRSNIMNPRRTRPARPVTGFSFNPPSSSNVNPFGSRVKASKKKKHKVQYKIIGGKAYPIASTMKKKKQTKHRHKLDDPFDFSGW